jgi:intracellular septation protein
MQYLIELLPLVLFFIIYKFFGIFFAVISLIVTSLGSFLYAFINKKPLSNFALYNGLAVIFFSSLTIFFQDATFIKIKRTLIHGTIALLLLLDFLYLKKNFLQRLYTQLLEKISIPRKKIINWQVLEIMAIGFFCFLAISNEIVWRNFSEETWVNYKIFISPIFLILFVLSQIKLIKDN